MKKDLSPIIWPQSLLDTALPDSHSRRRRGRNVREMTALTCEAEGSIVEMLSCFFFSLLSAPGY
jgi:hypothetical protein